MSLEVRINDLVIRGTADVSRLGFYVAKGGFQGWEDGVDMRRNNVERALAHGSFDLPGYLGSRTVTIDGYCYAPTDNDLSWWRSRLTGLLAQGDSTMVAVENQGLTTWAMGRLAAKPAFDRVPGGRPYATFQLQLWFANPRRFGESRDFTADTGVALPAYHYGNFPAAPAFTVTGSKPSGYTITGPNSKTYSVTKVVVAGHPHVIDMATGYLSVDGVVQQGVVSSGDTWTIPGGAAVSQTLSGSGIATLTATVKDTYI
jgi:hypothetical protein